MDSQFHNFRPKKKRNLIWAEVIKNGFMLEVVHAFIVLWLICRHWLGGEENTSKNTLGQNVSGKQWVKKLIRVDCIGELPVAVSQQALDEQLNKVETDPVIPCHEPSISNKLDWTFPLTHSHLEYVALIDLWRKKRFIELTLPIILYPRVSCTWIRRDFFQRMWEENVHIF